MKSLLAEHQASYDLFICDVQNAIPKDDMASMEHPIFSLFTKPDMRRLRYAHNGNTLEIIPSGFGLATIHDKDVLIYIISQLIAKMREGHTPGKQVRITAYDLLVATNRPTNNLGYERLKAALDRLSGTRIKTNIKTNGVRIIENFGLIDRYGIIEKSPTDGRMIGIQITLSDWLYNAIKSFEVLTLHPDYFHLRKPLERRIYELARKHCGVNKKWTVKLEILRTKIGTTAPLKKFRFNLRQLVEANHLPDYRVSMEGDIVTFVNRRTRTIEGNAHFPLLLPETFEKAKRVAPGWDVYHLEREWREWIANKEKPKNPDAAFIAFCKKKHIRQGIRVHA